MARLLTEKRRDRIAELVIRVGGILVILVVAAIVANIGLEALPLFLGAEVGESEVLDAAPEGALIAASDPRREMVWALMRDGRIEFVNGDARSLLDIFDSAGSVAAADLEIGGLVSAVAEDGSAVVGSVRFRDIWTDGERTTTARWRPAAETLQLWNSPETAEAPAPEWAGVTANADDDGNLALAAWTSDGELVAHHWDSEDEYWEEIEPPGDVEVISAVISQGLEQLAVVTRDHRVRVFVLPALREIEVEGIELEVAEIRYLIGGGSLIYAAIDGEVGVVLTVPRVTVANKSQRDVKLGSGRIAAGETAMLVDDEIGRKLASRPDVEVGPASPLCRVVRTLDAFDGEPSFIAASNRRRVFLIAGRAGQVALYHSTSGRQLHAGQWADGEIISAAIDPKDGGAVIATAHGLLRRSIDNPHPEVSFQTLFMPVWYEGYAAPKWVWQSTGGSDAFEPKMSLWPLIFGTLKATLYAMVISVPLALLAAIYVSQLAPSWLQTTIKPAVELMAAVPSVVVGFLAALWLAPRLEAALFPAILATASLPVAVILALFAWRAVPAHWRRRMPAGGELLVLAASCVLVILGAESLAGAIETRLFDGDFQRFLFTEWGIRYDQRNSLVVGLALGFAVIPVIFTIAEDACSAVPRNLVSASRALGATRWQTAIRLVVPAASPGLFAAIMLGFGRAVGETMIVLMAAGNTPLLDLSVFNGMRTMSAAIAVEIPEAPVGGTLFRVLFLTGILLFAFTLVLTTVADLVGQFLRRRYARF